MGSKVDTKSSNLFEPETSISIFSKIDYGLIYHQSL